MNLILHIWLKSWLRETHTWKRNHSFSKEPPLVSPHHPVRTYRTKHTVHTTRKNIWIETSSLDFFQNMCIYLGTFLSNILSWSPQNKKMEEHSFSSLTEWALPSTPNKEIFQQGKTSPSNGARSNAEMPLQHVVWKYERRPVLAPRCSWSLCFGDSNLDSAWFPKLSTWPKWPRSQVASDWWKGLCWPHVANTSQLTCSPRQSKYHNLVS